MLNQFDMVQTRSASAVSLFKERKKTAKNKLLEAFLAQCTLKSEQAGRFFQSGYTKLVDKIMHANKTKLTKNHWVEGSLS